MLGRADDRRGAARRAAEPQLVDAEQLCSQQIGATRQVVTASASSTGSRRRPAARSSRRRGVSRTLRASRSADVRRRRSDAPAATTAFGTIGGTEYVRAAIPFAAKERSYTGAGRAQGDRRDPRAPFTRCGVRSCIAALAGSLLTLMLAIPLSATLVRRLRRLREAALRARRTTARRRAAGRPRRATRSATWRARSRSMQQRLRQQEEARRAFVVDRVARAAHAAGLARRDARAARRRPARGDVDLDDARALLDRARAQSRRLGRLAADLLDLSRIDARGAAALRAGRARRAEPRRDRRVRARHRRSAVSSAPLRGRRRPRVGARRSGQRRADPADPARQRGPRQRRAAARSRSSSAHGPRPSLSVSDQGPGVPPEERELIFERFKRGHDTGGEAGFGLGLAIGRELAERMGGELVLDRSGRRRRDVHADACVPAQAPAGRDATASAIGAP